MTRAIFLLFFASLLSGCAAFIVSPVSDSDRDTTNSYDGKWRLTTVPLSATQTVAQKSFTCTFGKEVSILRVKDGVAFLRGRWSKHRTNVSASGKFFLEIPTDGRFQRSDGFSEPKNRLTIIYQGILSDPDSPGLYTLGHEAVNNAGCSTKLKMEKI